ncbi:hypothetical protein, partial [Pseudomonas avellanae]
WNRCPDVGGMGVRMVVESLSALAVQRLSNLAKSIIRLCFVAVFGTLLCFLTLISEATALAGWSNEQQCRGSD